MSAHDVVDERFVREVREGTGQVGGREEVQAPVLNFIELNKRQGFPFLMDNGPDGRKYEGRMRFGLLNAKNDQGLAVDLNGVQIPADRIVRIPTRYMEKRGYWCEFPLAVCPSFQGENELGIRLTGGSSQNQNLAEPPQVDELKIEISSP